MISGLHVQHRHADHDHIEPGPGRGRGWWPPALSGSFPSSTVRCPIATNRRAAFHFRRSGFSKPSVPSSRPTSVAARFVVMFLPGPLLLHSSQSCKLQVFNGFSCLYIFSRLCAPLPAFLLLFLSGGIGARLSFGRVGSPGHSALARPVQIRAIARPPSYVKPARHTASARLSRSWSPCDRGLTRGVNFPVCTGVLRGASPTGWTRRPSASAPGG